MVSGPDDNPGDRSAVLAEELQQRGRHRIPMADTRLEDRVFLASILPAKQHLCRIVDRLFSLEVYERISACPLGNERRSLILPSILRLVVFLLHGGPLLTDVVVLAWG
ncbi:hypothetical protein [Bradyrhizobium sp. LMTR 3]|uniref:hypothetical protein n=1 Tax=Bradyrhizobium sp. LMTR 3 TaxID=189873 RepID=UPI00159F327A|nr:hypothetical protein [Bradyrhizobium sp. LMTR 3]